jgi:hypothetical protein
MQILALIFLISEVASALSNSCAKCLVGPGGGSKLGRLSSKLTPQITTLLKLLPSMIIQGFIIRK